MPPLAYRTWTPEAAKHVQNVNTHFHDAMDRKEVDEAITLGEELCRLDDCPQDRFNLACVYIKAKRFDDGMKKLQEAIDFAGHDPTFLLGEAFREDSDLDPIRHRPEFPDLQKQADSARWKPTRLEYETNDPQPVVFVRSGPANDYLTRLRTKYNLEALVAGSRGDMERVKILCTWVHTRWNHIGDAENQPTDPIGLLEAAEKGDNFRCVEYGITVARCLNAIGIPARKVAARAQDVETRRFSAGHVFAEAYLRDREKWVFVDPQLNIVGESGGQPLNTIEFRQAFAEPNPKVHYNLQLGSCFYYFSYDLDGRYPSNTEQGDDFVTTRSPAPSGNVLLAPKSAPIPHVFQRIFPQTPTMSTHNPADVYGPPTAPE